MQHPYPYINIMATGQHGKKGRHKNKGGAIDPGIRPRENIDKEDKEDRGNLTGCRNLAEDGRDRFYGKGTSVEEIKTYGYNKVLQDNKRREPYGNNIFDAQHNKSRDEHCLVRDGIEVRPQVCLFAHDPCDKSIKQVCDPLKDKKV